MYEIFERLLAENGVKASDVSKATGIRQGVFTDWKKGRYTPKDDKMIKIAEYFGVSLQYIRTGEDERYSDENAELVGIVRNNKKISMAIQTLNLFTKKDQEIVFELISSLGEKYAV